MTTDLPGPAVQPVGVLPWPAGLLLLPEVPGADQCAADLLLGIAPDWPSECAFLGLALTSPPGAVAAAIPEAPGAAGEVAAYNRAVLVGDVEHWEALRSLRSPTLQALRGLVMFSLGFSDQPPAPHAGLPGEVQALLHSAAASAYLEAAEPQGAIAELGRGAAVAQRAGSPLLAASLLANQSQIWRDGLGDGVAALQSASEALEILEPVRAAATLPLGPDAGGITRVAADCAELHLSRALSWQLLGDTDVAAVRSAIAELNAALLVFTEADTPELWATCQELLGLAYLATPMGGSGDRIRLGAAVSALRAALRVLTVETNPSQWASAQLNLANALVYLPSMHQQDNLLEAVDLYEEILAHRSPQSDPLGVARVLANQGNALGHLGSYRHAQLRLEQAAQLFRAAGDASSAADVEELLVEVRRH